MGPYVIEVDDPRRNDVHKLLEAHLAFMRSVALQPEDVYALELEGLLDPTITFFSVRGDGQLLGVGALKQLDAAHAELKSMHTAQGSRRRGVARALVEHLLEVAAARGVRRVSLETGAMDSFIPARTLYASAGFVPCGPFGDYPPGGNNVFMTRAIG